MCARRAASATNADQDRLRQRVVARPASTAAAAPNPLVLGYLERHKDALCGHPVALDSANRVVHVVAHTNVVAGHSFANAKLKLRRRLGRAHLGRNNRDAKLQAASPQPGLIC